MIRRFVMLRLWLCATLLPLSAVAAHCAETSSVTATTLDGAKVFGRLIAWEERSVTLRSADESVVVTAEELVSIRWNSDTRKSPDAKLLTLTDGARIPFSSYTVRERVAAIRSPLSEEELLVPTSNIAEVQFQADPVEIDETAAEGDRLVVRGKQAGRYNTLSGVLGDVEDAHISFTWDGETIPVKRAKVAAISYYHAPRQAGRPPISLLVLRNGARLPVSQFAFNQQALKLRTPLDIELSIPLELIAVADYARGKIAYLSDLLPVRQEWTPLIGLPPGMDLLAEQGLPRRDQSFDGSALALRWPQSDSAVRDSQPRTYAKGLALRSGTVCGYRLPKGMRRFQAIAGIDPETYAEGHVTLELLADRMSIWQAVIDGKQPPVDINVEVGSARELTVVVDYGENLDFGDRLHLVEARVTK